MFFVLNNPGLGTNDDGLCTVFEAGSAGGTRPRLGWRKQRGCERYSSILTPFQSIIFSFYSILLHFTLFYCISSSTLRLVLLDSPVTSQAAVSETEGGWRHLLRSNTDAHKRKHDFAIQRSPLGPIHIQMKRHFAALGSELWIDPWPRYYNQSDQRQMGAADGKANGAKLWVACREWSPAVSYVCASCEKFNRRQLYTRSVV